MRWITKYRKQRLGALAAAIAVTAWMPTVMALPQGEHNIKNINTVDGSEKIPVSPDGKTMDVVLNQTRGAVDWKSFNIAADETVNFRGPGNWMVLNRVDVINPKNVSDIRGQINGAGGTVFLINPNGITFGDTAQVDVGSLVASTLDTRQDVFLKTDANNHFINNSFAFEGDNAGKIEVIKSASAVKGIHADGVVALLAHEVENYGNINAKQVALASGKNINLNNLVEKCETEVAYDDKIGVVINTASDNGLLYNRESGIIKATDGYVLMKTKYAQDLLHTVIKNTGKVEANRIAKDEAGNIVLDGGKVLVDGTLKATGEGAGKITTKGYEILQINDNAKVDAQGKDDEPGTWNLIAKTTVVTDGLKNTDGIANKISSTAMGNALSNTNVNLLVTPQNEAYYSDIKIEKEISKVDGTDTTLTLTAGRNISVDADITSAKGKLNILLNADSHKSMGLTNSVRGDGANIIRANIETNGGDFETSSIARKDDTGKTYTTNGTYFGLKDNEKAGRFVKTNGGSITLGGAEVLVATGDEVLLDTKSTDNGNGVVTIEGQINSANAYHDVKTTSKITWDDANTGAEAYDKGEDGQATGKSHLAVITGALEDAVVSSTINTNYTDTAEAYVGGHVVAVKTDKDGYPIYRDADGTVHYITSTKDTDGNPVIVGTPEIVDGQQYIMSADTKTNVSFGDKTYRGWYKLHDGTDGTDGTYARFWGWTAGDEAKTIFFVQTIGESVVNAGKPKDMENVTDKNNYPDWFKSHGYALKNEKGETYYTNFAPKEPNDDIGSTTQMALAVNYDTHKSDQRDKILYSQWDDINHGTSGTNMTNYVVETDLNPTSLKINAGDVTLNGAVGNLSKLDNMIIDSVGRVDMNGSVQLNKAIKVKAKNDITAAKEVTAGDRITLTAGNDVNIGGIITSKKEAPAAITASLYSTAANNDNDSDIDANYSIVISAQGNFNNNVTGEDSAKALSGYNWKVYANDPVSSHMGKLNSGNFALWSWNQKNSVATTGNMYIFHYTPVVTYTAFDKTKHYGETLTDMGYGNSYAVKNSLSGQYTQNFKDGIDAEFMARRTLDGAVTDGVTTSAGYPSTAYVGIYDIDVKGSNVAKAWGYDVVDKTAKLTVTGNNPEDVKPQLDPHDTTNVDGSASYTTAPQQAGPGADRVLGLQSAELPFFREENGQTKLYGTYDVSIDPDKVKMEPTAKVLPEPDQPKNQYREYDKEITTKVGTAKFKLTYNGSTFDIYPVDIFGKKVLKAGDAAKNVEVESQALFAAFKEMGITLDDLDGVYTHFDNKKEVQSFRK